jgi:thioredoxin reductase
MIHKIAIIGAGPAGMAAALQLKRYGVDALLFDKDKNGSLLKNAWRVENYLGFNAISGLELLKIFQNQLKQHNIEPTITEVKALTYEQDKFIINNIYQAQQVIIASGTKPKTLPLKNVYYEVFPLLKERNKTIAIIGAGDAAFDYALNLAAYNKILILNKSNKIKALPLLVNKALEHKNITYKENQTIDNSIKADFILAAIGREPQKDFYAPNFPEQELIAAGKLHLIGDVKNGIYRQTAIAVADGIKIASQIKITGL